MDTVSIVLRKIYSTHYDQNNPSPVMCIFGNIRNHNELKEIMRTREYSCQSYSDQIEQRSLIEQFKRLLKLTNPPTNANVSII